MYQLIPAIKEDIPTLISYKLATIFAYASHIDDQEKNRIQAYVNSRISQLWNTYQLIRINSTIIGCLSIVKYQDGFLLDEIYLEKEHRNQGIGSHIIKDLIQRKKPVYLWVYQENQKAVHLYQKLGFEIIEQIESRYFMKHSK